MNSQIRLATALDLESVNVSSGVSKADRLNPAMPCMTFTVEDDGGKIIGFCELYNIDSERRSASFGGFSVVKNKVIPIRTIKRLFWFSFFVLGLERIELRTLVDNESAIRFARLFGFRPEGILRKAARVNGQAKDVIVFALTKDDMKDNT